MTSDLLAKRGTANAFTALLLGAYGCAVAFAPDSSSKLLLAAPLLLAPVIWWTICMPNRWLLAFIATAWLLPPLPFDVGSSGPHVALLFAAIGAFATVSAFFQWQVKLDLLAGSLLLLLFALLVSCIFAVVYSSLIVGLGCLTRVLLFGISVCTFVFVREGPFQSDSNSLTALFRLIYWAAVGSCVLACVDFFLQLPAAPGHSVQFIWLDSGIYRRAQGVFYESSTLGNLCVFALVMIIAMWLEPRIRLVPKWGMLIGSVPIVIALIMSYSRGSLASLGVAVICFFVLKGRWSQWKRTVGIAIPALAASVIAAFVISPALAGVAWLRLAASMQYLWTAPDAVLSGRWSNWITLIDYISDEPWMVVFGRGYKTLSVAGISGGPVIADNTYLSLLIEAGVIGLATLLMLNIVVLCRAYRAARSANPTQSFLGIWIFCFWMGEAVQMLSGDLLTYWRVLPVFFCIIALADRSAP